MGTSRSGDLGILGSLQLAFGMGMCLTVRSADSHVRSTPNGSVYVVLTARIQRASSEACLEMLVGGSMQGDPGSMRRQACLCSFG